MLNISPKRMAEIISHPKTGKYFNEKTGEWEYFIEDKRVATASIFFFEQAYMDEIHIDQMIWEKVFERAYE